MSSWVDAWYQAEQVCFEYLRTVLEAGEDDSFVGEIPKDFQYSEERGMWLFAIEGGGEVLDFEFNMNDAACVHDKQLQAMFMGIWPSRRDAMNAAGTIMDALPVAEDRLVGITRFKAIEEPRVERTTIPRRSDQEVGGEMRVWQVTYPMHVLFTRDAANG